jgi:hypothetical protein
VFFGKSLELLGLATFNIFVAIIMSATFLSGGGKKDVVSALNEENIEKFINDVSDISNGKTAMDTYAITSYLMDHVADSGSFKTKLEYTMQDGTSDQRTLEMDKKDFISGILQGLQNNKNITQHETKVRIEYIKIADGGKRAEATTTTYERGMMEMPDDAGQSALTPIDSVSYCEQTFALSEKKLIQMSVATCTTSINFSSEF